MQLVLEELIRGVGVIALKIATFGRYPARESDRLAEGAIGFAIVLAALCIVYALAA